MTLLKCDVRRGMFSDESIIEIDTADGRRVSFFVPKSKIRVGCGVEVRVVRTGSNLWATLPTAEPFHAVPVRASDLVDDEHLTR